MRIIGRTVQVTAGEQKNKTTGEVVCRGEDKGRTGVVLGWIEQRGMPDAPTPAALRWLVSVQLEGQRGPVNFYPGELALDDGAALPVRPDPSEEV